MTFSPIERPPVDSLPLELSADGAAPQAGAPFDDLAEIRLPEPHAMEPQATDELTDWDWVRIAREGGAPGEHAFAELYKGNFGKVHAMLRRMRCPADLVPDITQETFVRLYTHLSTLEPQNNATLATWLQKVAQNLYISHRRRFDTRLVVPVGDDISVHADSSLRQQLDDPQHIVLRAFENRRLWDAMLQLTPEQRQVLYLRHYEGFRLRAAGELLGKTEGGTRMLHQRAARRMATLLLQNASEE